MPNFRIYVEDEEGNFELASLPRENSTLARSSWIADSAKEALSDYLSEHYARTGMEWRMSQRFIVRGTGGIANGKGCCWIFGLEVPRATYNIVQA